MEIETARVIKLANMIIDQQRQDLNNMRMDILQVRNAAEHVLSEVQDIIDALSDGGAMRAQIVLDAALETTQANDGDGADGRPGPDGPRP